ncbi:MAG: type II toxin-antitoxin system VapC family toxin [Acidobacteriota bacterium]
MVARYDSLPQGEVAASVASYEEQLRGRLAVIRQAKTPEEFAVAYLRLREMQEFFCSLTLLDFDLNGARIYVSLRQAHRRADAMDLRIAATALAHDITLVTNNTQDFIAIANLRLENWA